MNAAATKSAAIELELAADKAGVHHVALESYGYRWFRVGGLSYALHVVRDSGAGIKW
jgi:hypothetical protein